MALYNLDFLAKDSRKSLIAGVGAKSNKAEYGFCFQVILELFFRGRWIIIFLRKSE